MSDTPRISTLEVGGLVWKTTYIKYHDFRSFHGATYESYFTSCGHTWCFCLYPNCEEGMVALSMNIDRNPDEEVAVRYSFSIKDPNGKKVAHFADKDEFPLGGREDVGPDNFVERAEIDDSVLHDGSLLLEVRMKLVEEATPLFIPENPSGCKTIQKMFMDEKSSDVIFEVSAAEPKSNSRKKAKNLPVKFYAHRIILQNCSPTLSDLCASSEDTSAPLKITDVKPDTFHNMLHYIYGGEVPDEFMKSNFKEIIEASDKYGVSNLKLTAEACYVECTTITTDNLMEHLLYADSKNCALLKEKVMDFIAENGTEVLQKVSFQDLPGGPTMFTDILTSVARMNREAASDSEDEGELTTMKICELRQKAHDKGLEIDGSRETLIAMLEEST